MNMNRCELLGKLFTTVQNMTELMTDCPAEVDAQQLVDLGIALADEPKKG